VETPPPSASGGLAGLQNVSWPDPYQPDPATGKPCVTGIIWMHSKFRLVDVTDGLSHTYMLGEKYIDQDYIKNGDSWGDDQGPFVSDDRDILRWAASAPAVAQPNTNPPPDPSPDASNYFRPHHDARGNPYNAADTAYGLWGNGTYNFGSAHPFGFNMALCDGSVRNVSYEISEEVHRCYCNRTDGVAAVLPE
jgi:prepilin-type processing-associated H-X9-DG protein